MFFVKQCLKLLPSSLLYISFEVLLWKTLILRTYYSRDSGNTVLYCWTSQHGSTGPQLWLFPTLEISHHRNTVKIFKWPLSITIQGNLLSKVGQIKLCMLCLVCFIRPNSAAEKYCTFAVKQLLVEFIKPVPRVCIMMFLTIGALQKIVVVYLR